MNPEIDTQKTTLPPPVRKSEAVKSALLSAIVIPGAGQLYNREWIKGLFVTLLFLASSLTVLVTLSFAVANYWTQVFSGDLENPPNPLLMIQDAMVQLAVLTIVSILLYIYSIYDAYSTRKRKEKSGEL